ncbi:unnamed protein product [Cuscuta epithymum]|uniref:Protein kinase domain-containing protein n=1 Tax=Cuscuta epithymum TaxID=186058 RepID=A0AAV0DPN3_9ASTE|nr:unnamed protein product [Cuscuta epithymum]
MLNYRRAIMFLAIFVYFLLSNSLCYCLQSDIDCLKSVKSTLQDPQSSLADWDFNNNTEGFICRFTGIECWHPEESKVLNIKLSDMKLKGTFPIGLKDCKSLTGLDLSRNQISGSIPSNISKILIFVTTLDLSSNQLSGQIPEDLARCSFLNAIKLENNQLSGQIPPELGQLGRITTFSVENNRLSGPVPSFGNKTTLSYNNNVGLCGAPFLLQCKVVSKKANSGLIAGAAAAGVSVGILSLAIAMYFYFRRTYRKKEEDPDGNSWARSIKGAKSIELSMFEKSVSKMRLSDLMQGTDNFNKTNIIGSGRTGTLYKAVVADGTSFMVKRLQNTQHSEKEFASEMATLGSVKNRNLVPLFGFCIAKQERLLVYKYMPNGTLHSKLHDLNDGEKPLDWTLRLKIAIGAAKGFAWLHHNCNPRILHRNISSKCILLDEDLEPKISDFGLARLMNPIDTHLSTFVNGEFGDFGYVAPEYFRTLVATPKGDVYSFGVVLLELVTGEEAAFVSKAPESFKGSLVEWITILSSESRLQDSIDESLLGKGCDDEVVQVLKVASRCVLPDVPKQRPSMFEVYQFLRAIGEPYNFTTDDGDIFLPQETDDGFRLDELIVARER